MTKNLESQHAAMVRISILLVKSLFFLCQCLCNPFKPNGPSNTVACRSRSLTIEEIFLRSGHG